jgi:hypothetical protein
VNPDTSLRAGEELMLKPPPERTLPISEMSGAQISIYRRALVRYLKHCAADDPRCQGQRDCLAEVMAEERARRLAESASGMTLAVPRIHLLQVQGHKDPRPVRDWIRHGPGLR